MVIPNLYETGSSNIISVGLQDVATGKSRTNIYAGLSYRGYASGAVLADISGALSNVIFSSDSIYYAGTFNNPAFTKNFDLDFDLPQTIEGETIISVPIITNGGGGAGGLAWLELNVIKVYSDSTTLSLLSGATRSHISSGSTISGAYLVWSGDMPRTTFKRNEKLRLAVYPRYTGAGGASILIAADPKDRPFSDGKMDIGSQLIIQLPFKIDL